MAGRGRNNYSQEKDILLCNVATLKFIDEDGRNHWYETNVYSYDGGPAKITLETVVSIDLNGNKRTRKVSGRLDNRLAHFMGVSAAAMNEAAGFDTEEADEEIEFAELDEDAFVPPDTEEEEEGAKIVKKTKAPPARKGKKGTQSKKKAKKKANFA